MKRKTKTTDEAMELLKRTRKEHIERGRGVADEIISLWGDADTKRVYTEMDHRGIIDHNIDHHWLGAVFRSKKYRWTGQTVQGAGHDKLAKVWTFA